MTQNPKHLKGGKSESNLINELKNYFYTFDNEANIPNILNKDIALYLSIISI